MLRSTFHVDTVRPSGPANGFPSQHDLFTCIHRRHTVKHSLSLCPLGIARAVCCTLSSAVSEFSTWAHPLSTHRVVQCSFLSGALYLVSVLFLSNSLAICAGQRQRLLVVVCSFPHVTQYASHIQTGIRLLWGSTHNQWLRTKRTTRMPHGDCALRLGAGLPSTVCQPVLRRGECGDCLWKSDGESECSTNVRRLCEHRNDMEFSRPGRSPLGL